MSEQLIYKKISDIMADCPAIEKSQKNEQQKFMYRGIDVVMNVLQPLFIQHRVFAVPEILEATREERQTKSGGNLIYTVLKVKYTFYAEDGSSVSAVVQGEGMDSADKSSNKAMSVAYKYACFQVLCIPTEEMKDPEAETPEISKPKPTNCHDCNNEIKAFGKKSAAKMVAYTTEKYGVALCSDCATKRAGAAQ